MSGIEGPRRAEFSDSFRNVAGHVLDGMFWYAGFAWTSTVIILPLLIDHLGGSAVQVGAAAALVPFGWLLPQIFVAPFVESRPYKKSIVLGLGLVQRLPWLAIAALLYWGYDSLGEAIIPLILGCFFLSLFMGGLGGSAWVDFVASSISLRWRGKHFGLRQVLGGAAGMLIGFQAKRILHDYSFPNSFALLFLLAFLSWMAGLACLIPVREHGGGRSRERASLKDYFVHRVPRILRSDTNFRRFLVIKSLMIAATQLPLAFYVVYAIERFALPSSVAGIFTTVMMCGTLIFPFCVGWLADRYGHRLNLCINCLVILGCNLLALLAQSPFIYAWIFLLLPIRRGIDITSYVGISMEFSAAEERPTYVAISNSFAAPFVLFGLVGGWIRGRLGYTPLFLLSSLIALVALLLLLFFMEDPRQSWQLRSATYAFEHQTPQ